MNINELLAQQSDPIKLGPIEINNNDYHAGPGVSSSGLKLIHQSTPKHYWQRYLNPDREPENKTPALILGDQIHKALLEPGAYVNEFYPLPEKYNRATKDGKENYAFHESEAAKQGRSLISAENHEICQRIAESVHTNAAASFLFEKPGLIEQAFYWSDPETGVLCKCKPDKLFLDDGVILDIKSTNDASPNAFSKSIYNYGYHISAAMYLRGVEIVTGKKMHSFVIVAYEKEPPYACAFYELDLPAIWAGQRILDDLLADFADCKRRDDWPSYPEEIVQISLPRWAITTNERVLNDQ